jgi:hypothetical protein
MYVVFIDWEAVYARLKDLFSKNRRRRQEDPPGLVSEPAGLS